MMTAMLTSSRLTSENVANAINGNYSATYTYDDVGNRKTSTVDKVTTSLMNLTVKKAIKDEILGAVKGALRFNIHGEVYSAKDKRLVSSEGLYQAIFNLFNYCEKIEVYRFRRRAISYLDNLPFAESRYGVYFIRGSDITFDMLPEILMESDDEPQRGSIVVECDIDNPNLIALLDNCYDPGFLASLKYVMSASALTKVKKKIGINSKRIMLMFSESGVGTISLFGCEEALCCLLEYAYTNSLQSESFQHDYCD